VFVIHELAAVRAAIQGRSTSCAYLNDSSLVVIMFNEYLAPLRASDVRYRGPYCKPEENVPSSPNRRLISA
jgi:hypothetical protein